MSNQLALFERTGRPRWHRPFGLGERWWTWSLAGRRFLISHRNELESLRLARVTVLANGYPTAVLPVRVRRLEALLERVTPLSRGLEAFPNASTPSFFRGLIGNGITGLAVSHFCSLLARALNDLGSSEPGPAMYIPPNPSPTSTDFAVHSDLFPRGRLLIIYDQVRAPAWSASLLLPWKHAFPQLERAGMPARSLARIRALLSRRSAADGFDELIRLLYDGYSPRGERIVELLGALSVCARFRRGEGYLLDDRKWLHGRLRTCGGMTPARFRRLVF